jgi:hypothetical protein
VALLSALDPDPSGYLFGVGELRCVWERVRERAGCPDLQLRDARRTFASIAVSTGKSLDQIGGLLHHVDSRTTRRYAWLIEDARRQAVDEIGDQFAKLMTAK